MTIAEQIEARNARGKLWRLFGRVIQIFLLAIVPLITVLAIVNNVQTRGVASQAKTTADFVDNLLSQSIKYTCKARATTLRTAPMTIRDYRALQDAESPTAILVCPRLDYTGLRKQRLAEAERLKHGEDPSVIALTQDKSPEDV